MKYHLTYQTPVILLENGSMIHIRIKNKHRNDHLTCRSGCMINLDRNGNNRAGDPFVLARELLHEFMNKINANRK